MSDARANYTAMLPFERSVGVTSFSVRFLRPDRTLYAAVTVRYIICGISFFYIRDGTRILVLEELRLSSYRQILRQPVLVFYTLIQFPDGSSSENVATNFPHLPNFSTLNVSVTGDNLINLQNPPSCLADRASLLPNRSVELSDCSYGFTPFTNVSRPYFAVRFLLSRTGTLTFRFFWHDFYRGSDLDEACEARLSIIVPGSPEPSVVAVNPSGPFRRAGGQVLRCSLVNATPGKYRFKLGNHTLSPMTSSASDGLYTLSFITPKGQGTNIPWQVVVLRNGTYVPCQWAAHSSRFIFNYAESDIFIGSISPAYGPVAGGTTITCKGYFGELSSAAQSGDALWLGTYKLEKKYIVSIDDKSLIFILPPMAVTQSSSFQIDCWVSIHGTRSNIVSFTYVSLTNASIAVQGGSYQEYNNTHIIPICSKKGSDLDLSLLLVANVNHGALLASLKFEWHVAVMSTRRQVVSHSGGVEAQSFVITLNQLALHRAYEATVVISDARYNTEVTSSVILQPSYSRMLGVGLVLDPTRTIAYPPVDARVTASVTNLGQCFGSTERLSYEWTFLSKTSTLSYDAPKVDTKMPSPRRLGREFIIPRSSLTYGRHKVRVKVFETQNADAFGTAVGWLNVEPAPLQAVIGSGESLVQVSALSDLTMSASMSYDPDHSSISGSENGLSFSWACEISVEGGEKFASVADCPSELLTADDSHKEQFKISKSRLAGLHAVNGSTFVKYSLFVKKSYTKTEIGIRSSPYVTQVVRVMKESVSPIGKVTISSINRQRLDVNSIPYYEPIIMSPDGPEGTNWRYHVLEPAEEAFTFLKNPAHLIQLPGFFSSKDFIAARRKLGIRGGALKPNTEYTFGIEYESAAAKAPNSVEVTIRTMAKPTVTFLPLARSEGSPTTVFSAMAVSSVNSYSLKYFFFIKLSDGSEICIDGCSGQRSVTFTIPLLGTHVIRCVLIDAQGKYVLNEAKETHSVKVSHPVGRNESIASYLSSLSRNYMLGDHSSFELESLVLASYTKKIKTSNVAELGLASNLISSTLNKLTGLFHKTQPNTQLAKDYLTIARAFSSIPTGHEAISYAGPFYNLCLMLYHAVQNTPLSDRYDMSSELNSTLWSLSKHSRQLHSSGSSRGRLLTSGNNESTSINEALLELSELTVPLWSRVAGRDAACGRTSQDAVGGVADISIGTYCNSEQGRELKGRYSRLQWCNEVFGKGSMRKMTMVVGEFQKDYITESGVLQIRRRSGDLPRVSSEGNGSISIETDNMSSHGLVIVRTLVMHGNEMEAQLSNASCMQLTQRLRATGDVFAAYGGAVICESASGVEYMNTKVLNESLGPGAYSERMITSNDIHGKDALMRQQSTDITSSIGSDGHYGVKRTQCKNISPRTFGEINGAWVPVAILLGTIIVTIVLVVIGTRMMAAGAIPAAVEIGAGAYIERDRYGRNGSDAFIAEGEVEAKGDEDEVVFEGRERRNGG